MDKWSWSDVRLMVQQLARPRPESLFRWRPGNVAVRRLIDRGEVSGSH